jgi:hypothetical protein
MRRSKTIRIGRLHSCGRSSLRKKPVGSTWHLAWQRAVLPGKPGVPKPRESERRIYAAARIHKYERGDKRLNIETMRLCNPFLSTPFWRRAAATVFATIAVVAMLSPQIALARQAIDQSIGKDQASDNSRVRLPVVTPGLVLHVSPQGSDANAGTAEKPLASLEAARDRLRALRKSGSIPEGGALVVVHGGDYAVKRTFALGQQDSGTEQSPVIYRAAPGQSPRFSGGVALHGFKPVSDPEALKRLPAKTVHLVRELDLRAAGVTNLLPLNLGGFASGRRFITHPAHELFFNGQAMHLAHGPNTGFLQIADVAVNDGTKGYDREGSKVGRFFYRGDAPNRWAGEPDLLLYGYWFWDWADSYERVASIDVQKRLITLAEPWHNYGYSIGAHFYAVNALCELDAPGEFYLDRRTLRLFFYPPSDPENATVELSLMPEVMVSLNNASNIRFERMTWELGCNDGIHVEGGSNCIFAGCVVREFAGTGVDINGGRKHGLLSCDVYSMGRGGVALHGGNRKTLTPAEHFVENCDIHELSRIDHTYTPAVAVGGVGMRIIHNRLHDVLSSALNIGGNDHVIEYNEVFNSVLESDDQGAADMWGDPTFRGNVYRFNYWHDVGDFNGPTLQAKCGRAGIRLDDAISGAVIYGNIFKRCSTGKDGFGAVQINGGKENVVENNLFIDCAAAISFSPWESAHWREWVAPQLTNSEIDLALYVQHYPALGSIMQNINSNAVYRNVLVRCGELLRNAPKEIQSRDNVLISGGSARVALGKARQDNLRIVPLPIKEIGLYADNFRTATPHLAGLEDFSR